MKRPTKNAPASSATTLSDLGTDRTERNHGVGVQILGTKRPPAR